LQWLQEQSQINADNLNSVDMKLVGIPGEKGCNVLYVKLMSLNKQ